MALNGKFIFSNPIPLIQMLNHMIFDARIVCEQKVILLLFYTIW